MGDTERAEASANGETRKGYPPSVHGCTCRSYEGYGCLGAKPDGGYEWNIHPDCAYHAFAAANPLNHRNPWVCGLYWDGCNHVGGPLYSDEMHVLAWMLRTAQGYGWETKVDPWDGRIVTPPTATAEAQRG
jgi:hypothetical protein